MTGAYPGEVARRDDIHGRLAAHFATVGVDGRNLSRARWGRVEDDETHSHVPFGFTLPAIGPPGDQFNVRYCPDLIDEQTRHLTDSDLADYLRVLEFHIDMHITHFDEPLQQVEHLIDRTLADIALGSLRLASSVQMRALDPTE